MTGDVTGSGRGADARVQSLAELYRAESTRAVHLGYLLTGDAQLAQDLAQEAFVRVASRLRTVAPDAFGAYLRRTVVNLARSHFRPARVQRRYAEQLESDAVVQRRRVEQSSGQLDGSEREVMARALDALPARQREAIVCRYYLDLSEEQTADAMRIPVGTVKSATSRGLRALRIALEPEVAS